MKQFVITLALCGWLSLFAHTGQPPSVAHSEQGHTVQEEVVAYPGAPEEVVLSFDFGNGVRWCWSETQVAMAEGATCIDGAREWILPGEAPGLGVVMCAFWLAETCDGEDVFVTHREAKRILWDAKNMQLDCACGEPGVQWVKVCVASGGMEWINLDTLHVEFYGRSHQPIPVDAQVVMTCTGRLEYACADPCGLECD